MLTEIVVDAILSIRRPDELVDLFMVEIMPMMQYTATESRLVRGIVCDHGPRHSAMPTVLDDAFVLTANVSLEYEKTEVNSGFFYSSADQKKKLVESERRFTDEKVRKIIELKRAVCGPGKETERKFFLCNQKGIDPPSLAMLADEGIMALRRAKRRNMERITRACGGVAVNSVDALTKEMLGFAKKVESVDLGEEKYTFVEADPARKLESVTVLLRGPNKHTILQLKDALRDGLRAVKNAIEDEALVAGGGAFQVALHEHLMEYANEVDESAVHGVRAFAEAMLVIPKSLAKNAGLDQTKSVERLRKARRETGGWIGLDLESGEPMDAVKSNIFDCYRVQRQLLQSSAVIASQLCLVDSALKAGRSLRPPGAPEMN